MQPHLHGVPQVQTSWTRMWACPVVVPDWCSGPDVQKQFLDKDDDMPVVVQRQVLVST